MGDPLRETLDGLLSASTMSLDDPASAGAPAAPVPPAVEAVCRALVDEPGIADVVLGRQARATAPPPRSSLKTQGRRRAPVALARSASGACSVRSCAAHASIMYAARKRRTQRRQRLGGVRGRGSLG